MLYFTVKYPPDTTNTALVEARLIPIEGFQTRREEIDLKIRDILKSFKVTLSTRDYVIEEIRRTLQFSSSSLGAVNGCSCSSMPCDEPTVWDVRQYTITGQERQPFVEVKQAIERFVQEEAGGKYFQIGDQQPTTRSKYT